MKVKTSELTDAALDWAVAKCEGILDPVHGEPQPRVVFYSDQWNRYMRLNPPPQVYYNDRYEPSTDWAQGGPIIDRHPRCAPQYDERFDSWFAYGQSPAMYGKQSFLEAAMRCYVASNLGEEIEIPEGLI